MTSCYYLNLIIDAYPKLNFKPGDIFSWYAADSLIKFKPCTKNCKKDAPPCDNFYKLAHELGHAKLNHSDYKTKIELNRMELAAWDAAEEIVAQFGGYNIPEDVIDSAMQSYINYSNTDECPRCELSLIGDICPNCQI